MASTINTTNSAATSTPRVNTASRTGRRRAARRARSQGVADSSVARATPSTSAPPRRGVPTLHSPQTPTSAYMGDMGDSTRETDDAPGLPSSELEADEWAQRAIHARNFEVLDTALSGLPGGDVPASEDLEPLATRVHGRAVNRVHHCLEHGLQPEAWVLNAAVSFGSVRTRVNQVNRDPAHSMSLPVPLLSSSSSTSNAVTPVVSSAPVSHDLDHSISGLPVSRESANQLLQQSPTFSPPSSSNPRSTASHGIGSSYVTNLPMDRFKFGKNDLPEDLRLTGATNEDVRSTLDRFLLHVQLSSGTETPVAVLETRAITFLPLVCRKTATQTLFLLQKGEIEWRSELELQTLRARGLDDSPCPPATWQQYCNAMSNLLSPPNLVSQLARSLMSLRMKNDQSTDDFSLEVTTCFNRFLNEARRIPSTHSSHDPSWEILKTALFESGLSPAVRLEMLKEDPSKSYAESRAKAKKHAAHLALPVSPTVSSVHSSPHAPAHTQMENQVSLLTDAVDDLRRKLASQDTRTSYASTITTGGSRNSIAPRTLKRAAKPPDGTGKKPRRGQFTPTPDSAANPQYPAEPAAHSEGRSRATGMCKSPFCRDRNRAHETKHCQALLEFLRMQRSGDFDSITTDG